MKLSRWSLYFAAALVLRKTKAQGLNNTLATLHNSIEHDIENHVALEAPTFRAEDTKAVRMHQANLPCNSLLTFFYSGI